MSRVLMLDLGETLVHEMTVLPHVPEALEALSAFKGDNGKTLQLALVSDTDMPTPPATASKVKAIFDRYVADLEALNLRRFFNPVGKHVTLSAHAGVFKPDRKVFALALKRLGVSARLVDCVFVTENAEHVRHCREALKMKALEFGKDFSDWSEAPLLLSALIGRKGVNLAAALKPWGAARGLEGLSLVAPGTDSDVMQAQAQTLVPLQGPGLEEAEGAYVQLPVRVALRRDASGRITPSVGKPSPDDVQEAMSYVRGLVARGEIGGKNGPLTTHSLETDDRGRRLLKRRAFKTAMS
jgi:hypothetical protein